LSVSRVGGAAQAKAMKKVASKLKLDLAQYREMAAFSQFEGELDEQTKNFLNRGARLTQILIQDKNDPYSLALEVAVIYAASSGMLDKIPVDQIKVFEQKLVNHLKTEGKKWIEKVNKTKVLDEKDEEELKKFISDLL